MSRKAFMPVESYCDAAIVIKFNIFSGVFTFFERNFELKPEYLIFLEKIRQNDLQKAEKICGKKKMNDSQ